MTKLVVNCTTGKVEETELTVQDLNGLASDETIRIYELQQQVQEAKWYLNSTDFKMTVDYFATLTVEEQTVLTSKRAEAREFIRLNEVK